MVPAEAPQPRRPPDPLLFGAADVLAAMGMTALLAGLLVGAVVGLACLVAQALTPLSAAVAHAVLRAGPQPGRPDHP